MNLIEQIKTLIEKSDKSRYQISMESGVEQSALSRLVSGERGVKIESAVKILDALNHELVILPKRGRGTKGARSGK